MITATAVDCRLVSSTGELFETREGSFGTVMSLGLSAVMGGFGTAARLIGLAGVGKESIMSRDTPPPGRTRAAAMP